MSIASSISGGGGSGSGGGVSGISTADGGTGINDNKAVRGDGTTGIQGSVIDVADSGAVTGATLLDVDNLRLDGNTLSATNASGSVVVAPNGGALAIGSLTANDVALKTSGAGRLRVVRPDVQTSPYPLEASNLRLYASDFSTNSFIFTVGGGAYMGLFDVSGNPRIKFTRSTNAENSHDAGVSSPSAGLVLIDNGSTGIGTLGTGRPVEANTAVAASPNLLLVTESRKLLTNDGATAENYHTLPAAAPGLEFAFYCADTDGIRVTANGTDTIRIEGSVSGAGGRVTSTTIGSAIILTCPSAAIGWVAISKTGTWVVT